MEKIVSALPFKIDRNLQIVAGIVTGVAVTGYIAAKVTASIK